jgi:menaquinone-9 beta-reductase
MLQRTDVFVIGGGPAGLAAAIAAARKGFHVTVADGSHPPIDKPCGEGLLPDALAALRELRVTIPVSDGRHLSGIRFLAGEYQAAASFPAGLGIGIRRPVLHERLVDEACASGVSFLWRTPVTGLQPEGVVTTRGIVAARWVVGADGLHSRVRRWCGLESLRQSRRFASRSHYRARPWSDHMEVYWGDEAQAYVTPVAEEEVCLVVISRSPETRFTSVEARFPRLAQHLGAAVRIGVDRGAVTAMQRLRRVHRDHVALLGDASGSVDAITGEGLSLSFRQAVALADALALGDLRHYEDAHRRLAWRPTMIARLMLLLAGHKRIRQRIMRALSSDPNMFARLLAVHVGATSAAHMAATSALLGWRFVGV